MSLYKICEQKLKYLNYSKRTSEIYKPIAKVIVEKMGYHSFDILGPFGLTSETSIHFYPTEESLEIYNDREHPEHENWTKNIISISFRPHRYRDDPEDYDSPRKMKLHVVDYTRDTGASPKGSIGHLNGFNKPEIDCSDWDLDKLIEFMLEQNKSRL